MFTMVTDKPPAHGVDTEADLARVASLLVAQQNATGPTPEEPDE